MRYLTIILAVGFGMLLLWIMLLNKQLVQVNFDWGGADRLGWLKQPAYQLPMWGVIFWSVGIGIVIGFLLTLGGGADRRRRLRDLEADPVAEDDEPDYVVGLSRRR